MTESSLSAAGDPAVIERAVSARASRRLLPGALRALLARHVLQDPAAANPNARLSARMESVLGIAERLTKTVDRAAVYEIVVTEAQRILGVDGTTIRIRRGELLEVAAWAGFDDDLARQLPNVGIDEGWFAEVFRTGRPWLSDDVRRDPFHRRLYGRIAAVKPIASALVMPLIHGGRVIGALSAISETRRRWNGSTSSSLPRWRPMPRSPSRTPSSSTWPARRPAGWRSSRPRRPE